MTATEFDDSAAPHVAEIERLRRRVERERSARLEAERIAEAATRASIEDPLTGLANRTLLTTTLQNELARAARHGRDVALFYIDLDRFKLVNDTYGHEIGDNLLVAVADALRATTRNADMVGRLGGDEFLVIAPGIDVKDAMRLAARIAAAVERIYPDGTTSLNCRASVGVAMLAGNANLAAEEFVRQADVAMYAAKAAGAEVRLFDRDLHQLSDQHRTVRRELPGAIERREIVVHHEPIVATDDRRIIALEALARWPDETGGVRLPASFIPVAEEDGQIVKLGLLVAELAIDDIKDWQHTWSTPEVRVAVNTSPRELAHPEYAPRLTDLFSTADIAPERVIVEVTESALIEAGPTADQNLHLLRKVGVQTALDDFGTGYSSLSRLRENHFDVLKIDRSFTVGVDRDADARAVVSAILALADAFDVEVIAEGVETATQLEVITDLGCRAAQGWFFAQAKPLAEVGSPSQFGDSPWREG